MKVSQEPQKLSSILEDKYFKVPLYQREYSWTLNEVSDLYYDILESLKEEEGHFFGSLLLYKLPKFCELNPNGLLPVK